MMVALNVAIRLPHYARKQKAVIMEVVINLLKHINKTCHHLLSQKGDGDDDDLARLRGSSAASFETGLLGPPTSLIIPQTPGAAGPHFAKFLANRQQLPCAATLIFPRGAPLLLEDFRTGWRIRRRSLDRKAAWAFRPCNNRPFLNSVPLNECRLWGHT